MTLLRRFLLFSCCCAGLLAGLSPASAAEPLPADRIVAVVNDEVITLYELNSRLATAVKLLQKQGTTLPAREVLERQMLERLIIDKVQLQQARDTGLKIDDAQLEQALQRIAAGNKMSMAQFREALQKDGITFAKFREEVRQEITIARVRERDVDSKIVIGEGEIDNYLADAASGKQSNEEFEVAHVLLRTPEAASSEQIARVRAKADQVYERAVKGEDFAQLAASYSDAPDGLKGGSLGMRPLNRLPAVFTDAVAKLKPGEVAPVLRSPNGFHVVKLIAKRGGAVASAVEQTHVRHILIKVNEVVS